jgi:hypothetical protein
MANDQTSGTKWGDYLIPLWRIQEALRGYADAMESGTTPMLSGPEALREACRIMKSVG